MKVVRLDGANHPPALKDRQHFYNIAARVMRRVLVDHARQRAAERRGGGAERTTLTVTIAVEATVIMLLKYISR